MSKKDEQQSMYSGYVDEDESIISIMQKFQAMEKRREEAKKNEDEKSENPPKEENKEEKPKTRGRRAKVSKDTGIVDPVFYLGYFRDDQSIEEIERQFAEMDKVREKKKEEGKENLDSEDYRKFLYEHGDEKIAKDLDYYQEMSEIDDEDALRDDEYNVESDEEFGENDDDMFIENVESKMEREMRLRMRKRRGGGGRKSRDGTRKKLAQSIFPFVEIGNRFKMYKDPQLMKSFNKDVAVEEMMMLRCDPAQQQNLMVPNHVEITYDSTENIEKTKIKDEDEDEDDDDELPETLIERYSFVSETEGKKNWIELEDVFDFVEARNQKKDSSLYEKKKKGKKYQVFYISPDYSQFDVEKFRNSKIGVNDSEVLESPSFIYIWIDDAFFEQIHQVLMDWKFTFIESVTWCKTKKDGLIHVNNRQKEKMNSEVCYMFRRSNDKEEIDQLINLNPKAPKKDPKMKHQRWVGSIYDMKDCGRPHFYMIRIIRDLHPGSVQKGLVIWLGADPRYSKSFESEYWLKQFDNVYYRNNRLVKEKNEREKEKKRMVDEQEE